MEIVNHAYRRVVTVLVRNNTFQSGCLVLELAMRTYRDDQPIDVLMREYTVENHMLRIQHKLSWVTKPVRVCEVDAECPQDERLVNITIEWEFQTPVVQ